MRPKCFFVTNVSVGESAEQGVAMEPSIVSVGLGEVSFEIPFLKTFQVYTHLQLHWRTSSIWKYQNNNKCKNKCRNKCKNLLKKDFNMNWFWVRKNYMWSWGKYIRILVGDEARKGFLSKRRQKPHKIRHFPNVFHSCFKLLEPKCVIECEMTSEKVIISQELSYEINNALALPSTFRAIISILFT